LFLVFLFPEAEGTPQDVNFKTFLFGDFLRRNV
jgi:hypothetical protein